MAKRVAITGIIFSLNFLSFDDEVSGFLGESSSILLKNYHFAGRRSTESPCGKAAGAASLVVSWIE
jgi:hypothetical protein